METTTPHKPMVLMVEDEEDTASLLKFLLERASYRVVHAKDGRSAQELVDTMEQPDIILLDVMLPFLSGLQVLTYIRSKAAWEKVPIVMLTADGSEHDIKRALESGANDYMLKPFNPRELTSRLKRFLGPSA
ncbi:MAG: response regulator transcription factor [Nitrospira sp.]|jgi:DNA-binding response OmpR family regulator|nr:response regulator transcription factor [Nitrospira sp.]MBP6605236.1 response regulator transcription factor [Nitrospira sp.]MCI1278063.1 response regulator transcription factor [Nitrospira sp.]HQY57176.1 response regulator transcription factor [Nitrospira sp.]HRA96050.1 response regulator transcription factor [Nitrospira sp.]